jgi:membrane-bound ClpP family serine protease
VARGVHGGIVGQQVVTLDEVGDDGAAGHVQLVGERWLAITGDGQRIPPGTPVVVTAVQGTTLVVWPTAAIEQES